MRCSQSEVAPVKYLDGALASTNSEAYRNEPDILCLQEVFDAPHEVPIPDLMFNSLEHIRQKAGHKHVYFSPVLEMNTSDTIASSGNAIVSKYPLTDMETIFTNNQLMKNYSSTTRIPNTRNFQSVKVLLPNNQSINLVNHHAHWDTNPMGNEISVKKMQDIATFAKQLTGPPHTYRRS